MDAIQFYKMFKTELRETRVLNDGQQLFEVYHSTTEFTSVVTKLIKDIINREYTAQTEYFRIDVCGWVSHNKDVKNTKNNIGSNLKAHLWDLKIAVEHENNPDDWSDEVIKLVHVKCPVKVIIGYSRYDERGEIERKNLDFIAECMQKTEAFNAGLDEEYLVILGNAASRKKNGPDYKEINYIGYLYDRKNSVFTKLDD